MTALPRAVLVIGVQGAGKSTVGRLMAERCERGAFIEGDLLWKMVVAGRVDMSAVEDTEATRQLQLRYRHGALLAESFVAEGFIAVHADNIYGDLVRTYLGALRVPRSLVVLTPRPEVVVEREKARGTSAYAGWTAGGDAVIDVVRRFDRWLHETPKVGLWLDTSAQTPEETVDAILDRWDETFVTTAGI